MTVYVTSELKETIHAKFYTPIREHYDRLDDSFTSEDADSVHDILMAPYKEAISRIDRAFLSYIDGFVATVNTQPNETIVRYVSFKVRFSGSKVWFNNASKGLPNILHKSSSWTQEYVIYPNPYWQGMDQKLLQFAVAVDERRVLSRKLSTQLTILMAQNRTLRQLVKAFPPIKQFVPPYTLEKLKDEPAARVGKADGVDREFLTGMAALNRIIKE